MQKRLLFVASLLLAICNTIVAAGQLTIGDVSMYPGVEKTVSVELTNDTAYVGFQFDLYLPDGITVDDFAGSDRLPSGTTPQMAAQPDGSYRFIAAALSGNAIPGNSGAVMTITLTASQTTAAGGYVGYMRNVKVSKADGSGVVVAEQPFAITVKDAEAYAVLNGTTLTFYYDKQVEERGGMTDWSNAATATSVVDFDASFASYQPTSTAGWFKDFTSLTAINGIENLKTDAVTDMSSMFQGCSALTSLNLSGFNTTEVTVMYNMFMSCHSLETLDVSTFNTVKVTDMSGMFSDCIKLTELDLRYFHTANVETTMSMFYNCTALKTIYVGDGWNLENMPAGDYNTSSISMFENCNSIVGGAGTVYDMSHIDKEYARIDQPAAGLPGYLTSVADTITPATVTFSRDMYQLTMACETANVNIMYAVVPDGSAAAPTWQQYGGPVTLTEDCTVRAYAERPSGLRSAETEYTFKMSDVMKVETPTLSWNGDSLTISTATEEATVVYEFRFTSDGDIVETGSNVSKVTLHMVQDLYVKTYASKEGLLTSDTLSFYYPYTQWSNLWTAIATAQATASEAAANDRVTADQLADLNVLIVDAQQMYDQRVAEADAISNATTALTTATEVIRAILDEVYEPYAVLSADSLTVTFYYDGQKTARGGIDINSSDSTSPYSSATTAVIDASFADYYPTSTAYWFMRCSNLTGIDGMANLKTDNVTDMSYMFYDCSSLTSLDVSGFNTANVTDMRGMFYDCSGLTSLDVSDFNTANVKNMYEMFWGCTGLTSLDVSGFNTANVTDMNSMFGGCHGLTSLDVSGFNTANVTNMSGMFSYCYGLTSLDVSGFNTANVTYMGQMFDDCSGLTSLDVSGFNTANVTDMSYMFYGCSGLTSLDVSSFNTANVTYMSEMFRGCSGLTSLDVSSFNTANVTYMGQMFRGCSGLTSLDVSGFNTANVTYMRFMFNGCSGLTSLDLSGFNTAKVTDMGFMFGGCSGLTSLDLSSFNTANVTDMYAMFDGCSGLTSLDLSGFNTANVTDMVWMFGGCSGLTSLDLSGFNTANVGSMGHMFNGCSGLTTIYVGEEWSTAKVTGSSEMFTDCTTLVGGMGTVYDANHTDVAYAHIDGGTANPGYLTSANAPLSYAVTLKAVGNGTVKTADITVANGGEQDIAVAPGASLTLALTPDAGYRLENVTVDDTDVTSQVTADSTGVSYYTLMSIYAAHTVTATFVNDTKEAYAVLSADSLTVTFYYDGQKTARGGRDINVYNVSSSAYSSATTAVIDASFADYYPTSTSYWFKACSNLTRIDGIANLKTDNVTSMVSMFDGCSGLTSLDVSGFNTANVTSMYGVFSSCSGLTSLDVSGFNTANVTIMTGMFSGCSGLTSLDLSGFNTDNVTSMRAMFLGCSNLTSLDVSSFNTANVWDMGVMFYGCSGLTSLDLSSFNTANVTGMGYMFYGCSGLTSLDLSSFNTANVTSMSRMFDGCFGLTSLDLSGFNTANVTDMGYMFAGCSNLTTIYVGEEWSTANVTDSSEMFIGCTALVGGMGTVYDANHVDAAYAHIDGGTANPGYLTSANAPSSYAVTLKAVGNGTVKTADITVANGGEQDIAVAPGASLTLAFTPDAGYRLENVTVDDTDVTSQVTADSTGVLYYTLMSVYAAHTVTATFVNDTKEAYAVLSADGLTVTFYYDTQKQARGGMDINSGYVDASPYGSATTAVIDASFADYYPTSTAFWFCSCFNLTSIDGMVNLKTANVTDMSYMFYGCSGLTSLDLSGFNTANVTDMEFMFLGCSNLTTIYVGEEWSTAKVTESTEMFTGSSALVGGAWTAYDNSYVEADYAHIDGGTANPGYLTSAADATVPAVVTYSRVGHTVTLSSATANVHIMYTISTWVFADDEPQWEQYTDPLALTGDCTITAYAVRPSGLRSADTEYNFVLNANFVEAPTIARDGEENRVVITNNSTTGTVYYNYDANGQLTATNSSQYVGPIDVSQNVRINAAVIIDGVVSSDITSFTVDWFKVATPTYTWDADKLTATTTTDGASVEVSLTLPGDSVAAQVSGGVQTAIVTVEQDVRIDIRAMKDGWTDADVVSFDYPYTAWMQLMQAVDHGHQTMAAAAQSDKVDTVSPDAPYARLNALLIDAEEWYALRTAERLDIEELTARIQMTIAELEQEMNAVDEFAYDADNGVLHVYGNGLLEDALAAAGGREEVAKTLTAILWDKQQTLTDDMLQGLTGNPNLLIYVPGIEQAPVTVHNVVVGDRAEDILLVDATEGNSDFYCPRTFTADKISYTRNFTQKTQVGVTRGWESIVLPFTVQTITHESHGLLAPFGNDASTQHFWLRQLSPDGLERATEIVAYRPYLISMPNDSANYSAASCHAGRVTFTATDVDVMAATPQPAVLADETRRLIGTTRRVAAADDIYVLNVGQPDSTYLEGSVFVRNLRGVRPFECFTLHVGDGSRYISFDELSDKSTLGIAGTMYDGMKQEQWFTIDGRKLQRRPATKGVYILNGRKVVVK